MIFLWANYFFGDKEIYFYIISFLILASVIAVLYKMKSDEDKARLANN
jgi:hypothetical protein